VDAAKQSAQDEHVVVLRIAPPRGARPPGIDGLARPGEELVIDDRIEIISPGTLPNTLTVENIRAGNSNLRNPILATFVAKGVLPYRGLGSGVPRALEAWPEIDFRDDREGGLFLATVRRKAVAGHMRGSTTAHVTAHVTEQVLALVAQLDGELARGELQEAMGLTHREHFRKAYLVPALEAGLVEMTLPDRPKSRSQRYRLTEAGRALGAKRGRPR
jgi:predicted HTH transcriptional regulator